MSEKSEFEMEVAALIAETLHLDDVAPDSIDPEAPLFGDGLGLDSIDALELSLEISNRYNYQIRSDDPDIKTLFASLRNLAAAIERERS